MANIYEERLKKKISDALENVEVGYHLRLTSLIDGVSTYTLTWDDGCEPLTFGSTEDAYAHIAARKRIRGAELVLKAIADEGYKIT